jgi:hypothetical protein
MNKKILVCPGGVAQWTSHPPQRQLTRARIRPGYKVFRKNSNAVDLNCIVCMLKNRNKGLGTKKYLKINKLKENNKKCLSLQCYSVFYT